MHLNRLIFVQPTQHSTQLLVIRCLEQTKTWFLSYLLSALLDIACHSTYKILHGFAPAYLNELLLNITPRRLLRSSSLNLLSVPKTKTVTYGDRSFSVIAPNLWNDLPIIIKQCSTVDSIKLRLKTFLFSSVYS